MPTIVNRVTPNTRRYTLDGRIGRLRVRGAKLKANVARAVLSASLDLAVGSVTELKLTLADPDLELLAARLFVPGTDRKPGSPVDYMDLKLECAAVEVNDGILTVTARELGAQKLRRARGKLVRRKLSPTEWASLEAKAAGLAFVGEKSPERRQIVRQAGDDPETSWDTLNRLAEELGYVTFVAAGVLYFGRPSWLADRAQRRLRVKWQGGDTDPRILTMPTCRRTGDNRRRVAEVSVTLTGELGDDVRPGHRLTLDGVPTFEGRYLIDAVTIPLDDASPVSVKASTPINPTPQPPDVDSAEARAGKVSVPRPRAGLTIKGITATREQLAHVTAIYSVGRKMGIPARGIRIAIATAIQESTMRNLSGGDRDSVGLFQQRPSQGWGTVAQLTDPETAARKFFNALKAVPGWETLTLTAAAQAVQRSAYPNAYAQWADEADELLDAVVATIPRDTGDGKAGGGARTAGEFVRIALEQAGDAYVYGAEAAKSDPDPDAFDCSELVEWALARVGVTFVDGSANQLARVKRIPVDKAIRTRGALLFHPGHVAISLGDGRTIEAANRSYGVRSLSAAGRFTAAGLVPGLNY